MPEILLSLQQELILNSEKPHPTPTWASAFSRRKEKHVGSLLLGTHMHEAGDINGFRFSFTCVSQEWEWLFLDFVA